MARTVDTSSTFENWRQNYNDLANDVGGLASLTTPNKSSIVNAINYIMDQYFFFQDFDYDGSDGATSNTVFSGNDNNGNSLQYSSGRVLVYKNGLLLRSGTDYTATNGTSVTLASSASNSDVIRISSFTGSYQGVGGAGDSTGDSQFLLAGGVLYNKNTGGVVLNADSSITNSVTTASTIQLEGNTHINGHFNVNSIGSDQKDIRFWDDSNSNYVALRASGSISSNIAFTLPTADGSAGQFLKTDGSGNFSFDTVSSTAPDITITANNSADETVYPVFVHGATGTQGLESDTGLTYNPSSGILTSTQFTGALSGNATTATTLASNRNFSITGDITASAVAFNGSGNVALSATIDDNTVDADALNISGDGSSGQALLSDGDGSFSWGAGGKTTEEIEDIVGGMLDGTETGISVSYDDTDGNIDFVIGSDAIVNSMIADDAIDSAQLADNSVDAVHLNVSGNGSTSQFLRSDGDGTFTWATPTDTNDNTWRGIDDTPVDGQTAESISSNWAYDHKNSTGNGAHVPGTGSSGTFLAHDGVFRSPPSGTVTRVQTGTGLTGDITGSGTISVNRAAVTNGATTLVNGNDVYDFASNADNLSSGTIPSARIPTLNQNTSGTAAGISGSPTVDLNNLTCDQIGVNVAVSGTDGRIDAGNDIVAYSSSDMTLKENINPITQALDKVLSLGGYTFDWKKEREEEHGYSGSDIGVLAQEVEDVLPTAVRDNCYGNKSVRYEKLIPLLVQSIKELKTELDELKSSKI